LSIISSLRDLSNEAQRSGLVCSSSSLPCARHDVTSNPLSGIELPQADQSLYTTLLCWKLMPGTGSSVGDLNRILEILERLLIHLGM
jgi:hypothetical protein